MPITIIVIVVLFLVRWTTCTPKLNKQVSKTSLKKYQDYEFLLPSDTFSQDGNSRIYKNVGTNPWISHDFVQPKIDFSLLFVDVDAIEVDENANYLFVGPQKLSGFCILNILDLNDVTLESCLDSDGRSASRIKKHGDILYVGTEGGFGIFNVADKRNPRLLKQFGDIFHVRDFVVDDGIAYVTTFDDDRIFDVSDPSNAYILFKGNDTFNLGESMTPYVVGDTLYTCDAGNGFKVYDVSELLKPTLLYTKDYGSSSCNRLQIDVQNNIAYIGWGSKGFVIANITDRTKYQQIDFWDPGNVVDIYFDVADKTVIFRENNAKKLIFVNVSDITDPFRVLSELPVDNDFKKMKCQLDRCYISQGEQFFKVVDISNKSAPFYINNVSSIHRGGNAKGIARQDDHLYVVDEYTEGSVDSLVFKIFDVSEKDMTMVFVTDIFNFQSIAVRNGYVYGLDLGTPCNLKILECKLDSSKKMKCEVISSLVTPVADEGFIYLFEDSEIAVAVDGSKLELTFINITNITNPKTITTQRLGGGEVISSVYSKDGYLYTNKILLGLEIYDISSPSGSGSLYSPKLVKTLNTLNARYMEITGGYAYIADSTDGLLIADVRVPENATTTGLADTGDAYVVSPIVHDDGSVNLVIVGNLNHANIENVGGLSVIDVRDKTRPFKLGHILTKDVRGMVVRDNIVYVADGQGGLKTIEYNLKLFGSSDFFSYFCGDTSFQVHAVDETGSLSTTLELSREDFCYGRGTCLKGLTCACDAGYTSDNCESWSCYDTDFKSVNKVCNGHGNCINPDECECFGGYVGTECETNSLLYTVMAPILALASVFGGICILLCISGIAFCCCAIVCCIILCFCSLCGIVLKQTKQVKKFGKLRNFDMLMKIQERDDDESIAHISINQNLFELEMDSIQTLSVLGEGGSNSMVFKAVWGGRHVAFKCFKTRTMMNTQYQFDEFEREVKILANISHPNIIRFFGACLKPPRVGIVMEFCSEGELLEFVIKFRNEKDIEYPIFQKIRLLLETASALEYLHSKSIIHRDLKSENVLVSSDESAKLMDFGLSRVVKSSDVQKTTRIGTNVYMSPEILTGHYDEKCDVFSFGIMMYVLLVEVPNPYGIDDLNIEFKVANDALFRPDLQKFSLVNKSFEEWMKKLMKTCWAHKSSDRPSMREIRVILEKEGSIEAYEKKVLNAEEMSPVKPKSLGSFIEKEDGGYMDSPSGSFMEMALGQIDLIDGLETQISELKNELEEVKKKSLELQQENESLKSKEKKDVSEKE